MLVLYQSLLHLRGAAASRAANCVQSNRMDCDVWLLSERPPCRMMPLLVLCACDLSLSNMGPERVWCPQLTCDLVKAPAVNRFRPHSTQLPTQATQYQRVCGHRCQLASRLPQLCQANSRRAVLWQESNGEGGA